MAWGGPEEQAWEWELGNEHTKDWQDEALKIIEKAMAEYWQEPSTISVEPPAATSSKALDVEILESEFDRLCCSLIAQTDNTGAWRAELHRYLADLLVDVKKDTDIVKWWQVRGSLQPECSILILHLRTMLNHFLHLRASPKTSAPFQRHLCYASDCFLQVPK